MLPVPGGAATTSTARSELASMSASHRVVSVAARFPRRLGIAVRSRHGGDDSLVRVHVRDGRDAHARRLDDVDDVDANAGTGMVRGRGVIPWHVDGDDGDDDVAFPGADAVALPTGCRPDCAPGPADSTGGAGVLPGVERHRNCRVSRWVSRSRRWRCSSPRLRVAFRRHRCRRRDSRSAPVHPLEGTVARLLPTGTAHVVRCVPMWAQPGNTACGSGSSAAGAAQT